MNPSDEPTRSDGQGMPISDAEPYRTPADVADTPTGGGLFRSPFAWFVAIGAVLAIGGFVAFSAVSVNTTDFGGNRGPVRSIKPVIEEPTEIADYERVMSAEE